MAEPHIQRIYGGLDGPCSPGVSIRAHLRRGETLLWAGRPAPLAVFSRMASVIFGFSLLLLVGGGYFMGYVLLDLIAEGTTDDWMRFAQGGLFIVQGLIGVGMVVGPALRSAWTAYAISDQRAMIVSTFLRRRVSSFAPEEIEAPLRLDRDEGYGHLIFAKRKKNLLLQDKERTRYIGIGFFRVRDVAEVETALLKLRASAAAAAGLGDPALKPA